jgi:glucose-6-phosphate isomerase
MKTRYACDYFQLELSGLSNLPDGVAKLADDKLAAADKALRVKFDTKKIGFYDLPADYPAHDLEQLEKFARKLENQFEGGLMIGIGGSYLGARALIESVAEPRVEFPLYWLSNVDPSAIARVERQVGTRQVATVVMSKSGGTTETLAGFFYFSGRLPTEGYLVITDPQSGYLRKTATEQGWLSLSIPSNIGGRFSVLTAVGLFPARLAGIDPRRVLQGALAVRNWLDALKPTENPAYQLAQYLYLWDKQGYKNQYLMPYWENLSLFSDWFVQLWGESLGKRLSADNTQAVGPTPVGALGSTDQHSLLQLFQEGPRDKVIGFIDVAGQSAASGGTVPRPAFDPQEHRALCGQSFVRLSHLACLATQKSLSETGVPTYRLILPTLTPEAMGALFFFYETACAFAGELYQVNAFDQPGVESTKKLWLQSLSQV